jgi:hypothetical protein
LSHQQQQKKKSGRHWCVIVPFIFWLGGTATMGLVTVVGVVVLSILSATEFAVRIHQPAALSPTGGALSRTTNLLSLRFAILNLRRASAGTRRAELLSARQGHRSRTTMTEEGEETSNIRSVRQATKADPQKELTDW